MKKPLIVLVIAVLVASGPAAHAAEVVIVGEATLADGQCLAIDGASSGAAGRSRWLTGYWAQLTAPPVCSDTDPHFDPIITCALTESSGTIGAPDQVTTVYIGATGPSASKYLIKIVDRPQGTDEFGVLQASPTTGPCGADGVTTIPVSLGGFAVAVA